MPWSGLFGTLVRRGATDGAQSVQSSDARLHIPVASSPQQIEAAHGEGQPLADVAVVERTAQQRCQALQPVVERAALDEEFLGRPGLVAVAFQERTQRRQ